jgi:hypothetical protein
MYKKIHNPHKILAEQTIRAEFCSSDGRRSAVEYVAEVDGDYRLGADHYLLEDELVRYTLEEVAVMLDQANLHVTAENVRSLK